MPAEAAAESVMANRISQLSTAFGIWAGVSWTWFPYGLAAACRFATWVSSEEVVIRSLPTIAAAPIFTGEQAASTTHAPRQTAPKAASLVPDFLLALIFPVGTDQPASRLPDTGNPFLSGTSKSRERANLRVGEYRTDDLRAPRQ